MSFSEFFPHFIPPPLIEELFESGDPIDGLIPGETVTDYPPSREVQKHALDEVEKAFREVFGTENVERIEDEPF